MIFLGITATEEFVAARYRAGSVGVLKIATGDGVQAPCGGVEGGSAALANNVLLLAICAVICKRARLGSYRDSIENLGGSKLHRRNDRASPLLAGTIHHSTRRDAAAGLRQPLRDAAVPRSHCLLALSIPNPEHWCGILRTLPCNGKPRVVDCATQEAQATLPCRKSHCALACSITISQKHIGARWRGRHCRCLHALRRGEKGYCRSNGREHHSDGRRKHHPQHECAMPPFGRALWRVLSQHRCRNRRNIHK